MEAWMEAWVRAAGGVFVLLFGEPLEGADLGVGGVGASELRRSLQPRISPWSCHLLVLSRRPVGFGTAKSEGSLVWKMVSPEP